jgi:uncharacterized protein (TIGR03067 family)
MKPRLLLALILPLCLVAVTPADDKAETKDLEMGSWKVTNMNQAGKDVSKEFIDKAALTLTFKDGKLKVDSLGDAKDGTFKIDSTKTPKEIDLTMEKDKPADKAIYEIEKDMLKIAIGKNGRPKDFKGGADIVVFTLERKK